MLLRIRLQVYIYVLLREEITVAIGGNTYGSTPVTIVGGIGGVCFLRAVSTRFPTVVHISIAIAVKVRVSVWSQVWRQCLLVCVAGYR